MARHMVLNGFTQCCATPQSSGQWKNPRDRSMPGFNDVDFWIDLVRVYERGCFDSLFFADVHGVYDVYGGSMDAGIRHGVQVPGNDPTVLLPLLARETRQLGFIATYSTTYFQPYLTAKLFSSLDHFTRGRVGWNIVTSYLSSAQRNGLGDMLGHDARYDAAEEYMTVCYKLWQQSWEDDAVVFDRGGDVLIDPARVHKIDHRGARYAVEGPHMCMPSPQRTPYLVQAGQSDRGNAFGARHAEALFCVFQNIARAAKGTARVRELEAAEGRAKGAIQFLQGVNVVVAETEAEVRAKLERYRAYANDEGQMALFGGWTGIDLSVYQRTDLVENFDSDQMKYIASFFNEIDPTRSWSIGDMNDYMKIGSITPKIVGTPEQVADVLEEWLEEGGIDGFNLIPVDQPGTARDFVDLVVPVLQKRGRVRRQYETGACTLRELYRGKGQAHLAPDHPAHRILAGDPVKETVVGA